SPPAPLPSFPTRRSSDLGPCLESSRDPIIQNRRSDQQRQERGIPHPVKHIAVDQEHEFGRTRARVPDGKVGREQRHQREEEEERSEEHTSELQSLAYLVC